MRPGLTAGARHVASWSVTAAHTVPGILPGSLLDRGEPVLASGYLLAMAEEVCWQMITHLVEPDEGIVGWRFDRIRQHRPSLPGDVLEIEVICTAVDTPDATFTVAVTNTVTRDLVAQLEHRLRVINQPRFRQRLEREECQPVPR